MRAVTGAEGVAIDSWAFRRAMGSFATGVTVITAPRDNGGYIGVTVNSFCSVSLEPPLVLCCLKTDTYRYSHFHNASHFNVNILAADQAWLSQRFAGSLADRFSDVPHRPGASGPPLIDGCAAHLECRKCAIHPAGDHAILLGEVEALAQSDRPGLVFHNGRLLTGAETIFDWVAPAQGESANNFIDFW